MLQAVNIKSITRKCMDGGNNEKQNHRVDALRTSVLLEQFKSF
jgi:hypothetical protein